MRLNRYRKFVESNGSELRRSIDGINGHDMKVVEHDDMIEVTFHLGSSFEISKLQDLFEQVAKVEKRFPDITWEDAGADFVFEFYL